MYESAACKHTEKGENANITNAFRSSRARPKYARSRSIVYVYYVFFSRSYDGRSNRGRAPV